MLGSWRVALEKRQKILDLHHFTSILLPSENSPMSCRRPVSKPSWDSPENQVSGPRSEQFTRGSNDPCLLVNFPHVFRHSWCCFCLESFWYSKTWWFLCSLQPIWLTIFRDGAPISNIFIYQPKLTISCWHRYSASGNRLLQHPILIFWTSPDLKGPWVPIHPPSVASVASVAPVSLLPPPRTSSYDHGSQSSCPNEPEPSPQNISGFPAKLLIFFCAVMWIQHFSFFEHPNLGCIPGRQRCEAKMCSQGFWAA